jgi:hypothetical protein
MRLPLRGLSDAELLRTFRAAHASVDSFTRATQRHGSRIQSWVGGVPVVALEHDPDGGVVDRRRGSQFFHHSHRAGDAAHGHLHLFWHATRSGRRHHLGKPSATGASSWRRSAPSHLVAIGLPVIARVLRMRDRMLLDRPDHKAALDGCRSEVVSTARLDWSHDLHRIEAEVQARALDAAS